MAGFTAIIPRPEWDNWEQAASGWAQRLEPVLRSFEWQEFEQKRLPGLLLCLADNPGRPKSYLFTGKRSAVFGFGEFDDEQGQPGRLLEPLVDQEEEVVLGRLEGLHGRYAILIHYFSERKTVLASDALGYLPVYYQRTEKGVVISNRLRSFYTLCFLEPQTDRVAIAQQFLFSGNSPDRTLFKGVRLLPQDQVVSFFGNEEKSGPLGRFAFWPVIQDLSFSQRVDRFHELLQDAVRKTTRPDETLVVLLSGGLDSRILAAELARRPQGKTIACSFGNNMWDELMIARQVVEALGIEHLLHYVEDEYNASEQRKFNEVFSRLGCDASLLFTPLIRQLGELGHNVVTGFPGDSITGSRLSKTFGLPSPGGLGKEPDDLIDRYLGTLSKNGFSKEELTLLFPDIDYRRDIADALAHSVDDMEFHALHQKTMALDYRNHHRRWVSWMPESGDEARLGRAQFCDLPLTLFCGSLPYKDLYHQRLYREVFVRKYPEMAAIRRTGEVSPMLSPKREKILKEIRYRAVRTVKDILRPLFYTKLLSPLRPKPKVLYQFPVVQMLITDRAPQLISWLRDHRSLLENLMDWPELDRFLTKAEKDPITHRVKITLLLNLVQILEDVEDRQRH